MADVTNHTSTPLGLPNGPVLLGKTTVAVEDWDSKSSNPVVKSWLDAGAITVKTGKAPAKQDDNTQTNGAGAGTGNENTGSGTGNENTDGTQTPPVIETDTRGDEFRALTNSELTDLITKNGGTVKAGMIKDDLVALALEVVKV